MDMENSFESLGHTDSADFEGAPRQLHVIKELAGSGVLADIIYIPGAGTNPPTEWSWVHAAARVLTFNHGVGLYTPFSWQDFLDNSAMTLLEDLVILQRSRDDRKCPIVFICHSCGGLILKQMLWTIHQQLGNPTYRDISYVISGVIFMGTPHSKLNWEDKWGHVSWILRSIPRLKTLGDPYTLTPATIDNLANLSRHFEQSGLQIPILSIYEKIETKVRRHIWKQSEKFLVDNAFAQALPNEPNEELFGVEASHHDMPNVMKTQLNGRINEFFSSVLQKAPSKIAERFKKCKIPFGVAPLTVRSYSKPPSLDVVEDHFTEANSIASTAGSSDVEYEIIPGLSDFQVQKKEPRLPCYVIKPHQPFKYFVGREDVLKMLDDALLSPPAEDQRSLLSSSVVKELKSFALCGMGGLGKTQIAVEFVYRRKKEFDAVFFVHADEPAKLAEDYCQIALELGLEDNLNARDQVASREAVKGFFSSPPKLNGRDARWLLVFDNADNLDVLQDFWPEHASGSVLVTSRDPSAIKNIFLANSGIHLSPMDIGQASTLLKNLTGSTPPKDSAEDQAANRIASRLDGLPLAILCIASSVRRRQISLGEFLDNYQEGESIRKVHELQVGRPEPRHRLATVWALEALSSGALALLQVLSLMDPDCIKEYILMGTQLPVDIGMSEYPQDPDKYEEARTELIQSSLVKRNIQEKELWIHRVLQDEVRRRMSPALLQNRFETLVALISSSWPFVDFENRHSKGRWPICKKIFQHLLRLKYLYESYIARRDIFKANASFAAILNEAGWYHHERGCSQEAKPFLTLAETICEPLPTSPTIRTLLNDIHYGQGAIATETNDPAACLTHYSVLLETQLEDFDQTQIHTRRLGVAYNEMGNAYMMNNQYYDAANMFKAAMKAYKAVDGFSPLMLSLPLVNLGLAYWLTGNFSGAEKVLLEALRERERAFGVDDTDSFKTGRILHALGNVRTSQGRHDESFELHQRALKQYKSTIGYNHHRTADLCHKVAEHHILREDHATAQILLDKALEIYGGRAYYKPEIARSSFKKGMSLLAMRKVAEAKQARDEAIKLYWEIVGQERRKEKLNLVDRDFDELVVFWTE